MCKSQSLDTHATPFHRLDTFYRLKKIMWLSVHFRSYALECGGMENVMCYVSYAGVLYVVMALPLHVGSLALCS